MNTFDFRREREEFILEIIGKNELTIAEIAEKLETDTGKTWGILQGMESKGLLISRRGRINSQARKRTFWRVK